jgi:hypothetical protein
MPNESSFLIHNLSNIKSILPINENRNAKSALTKNAFIKVGCMISLKKEWGIPVVTIDIPNPVPQVKDKFTMPDIIILYNIAQNIILFFGLSIFHL